MRIQDYFPEPVASAVSKLNMEKVREIRLCAGAPLSAFLDRAYFLDKNGPTLSGGIMVNGDIINKTLEKMSRGSVYSEQESLRQGFLSLEGGHRAGVSGKAVAENGKITALREISSINLRIAHEVKGAADEVMPFLEELPNTLIISPPGCGKTTLLRDIARSLSNSGVRVSICDERGEIAAAYKGVPALDVGYFTDVFTGPKVECASMLLRAMSPEVIITDEIGSDEDIMCIKKLVRCGVCVICSLHAKGIEQAKRSGIGELILDKTFERVIVLSKNIGKIERIY